MRARSTGAALPRRSLNEKRKAILPAHRRSRSAAPGTLIARRIAMGVLCATTTGAAALGISLHPQSATATTPASLSAGVSSGRLDALLRANRDYDRARPPAPATTPTLTPTPTAT